MQQPFCIKSHVHIVYINFSIHGMRHAQSMTKETLHNVRSLVQ